MSNTLLYEMHDTNYLLQDTRYTYYTAAHIAGCTLYNVHCVHTEGAPININYRSRRRMCFLVFPIKYCLVNKTLTHAYTV